MSELDRKEVEQVACSDCGLPLMKISSEGKAVVTREAAERGEKYADSQPDTVDCPRCEKSSEFPVQLDRVEVEQRHCPDCGTPLFKEATDGGVILTQEAVERMNDHTGRWGSEPTIIDCPECGEPSKVPDQLF